MAGTDPDTSVQVFTVLPSLKPVICDASKCSVRPVVTGGAALAGDAPKYIAAPSVETRARCLRAFRIGGFGFGVFIAILVGWDSSGQLVGWADSDLSRGIFETGTRRNMGCREIMDVIFRVLSLAAGAVEENFHLNRYGIHAGS